MDSDTAASGLVRSSHKNVAPLPPWPPPSGLLYRSTGSPVTVNRERSGLPRCMISAAACAFKNWTCGLSSAAGDAVLLPDWQMTALSKNVETATAVISASELRPPDVQWGR